MSDKNNPKIALTAAIICILFVVFVFVFPGLKEVPFVQGITGLAVTLTIAIVLFSAVPSKAAITIPIALGGAAAFFFIILPRVEPFVFPTYTITGTIYYLGTTQPVPGVLVRDADTSQSVKTDDNGDFRLPNVSRRITKLTAKSGGIDYTFELNAEKRYPIIKQLSPSPTTPRQQIDVGAWSEVPKHNCPVDKSGEFSSVKLFLVKKEALTKVEGFNRLYVRVSLQGNGFGILHAETLSPSPDVVREISDEPTARQWSLPGNENDLKFEIAVCVGARKGVRQATLNDLVGYYWFGKE